MTFSTPDIRQDLDPAQWKRHRWGIPLRRLNFLRDHIFWVTGAGTGYGQSIAFMLASSGATVFITGRRTEKLEATRQLMQSHGIKTDHVHTLAADITDPVQTAAACEHITCHSPRLDGIVHSAALPQATPGLTPLMQGELAHWERMMRTNVTAPWHLTRLITPHLLKSDAIRILFLTSEAGWADTPGHGQYNISKCALNNLTMSLAAEWVQSQPDLDVQINALIPGEAKTEMNQGSTVSPFSIVEMTILLLSHPAGGPNGHFFHKDGRHFDFAYRPAYQQSLRMA